MHLHHRASFCLTVVTLLAASMTPTAAESVRHTSSGVRCTVVGTAGNDVLRGTHGRDVICGRGGNDRIDGRGGDDLVDAGAGNDRVIAGAGADVIVGGAGKDSLQGATGDDRIDGGPGRDSLLGQAGADLLRGGAEADRVQGDAGDDRALGDSGSDVASGGSGDDVVTGGTGDDVLSGGPGGDEVDGGPGFNVCDDPAGASDTQVRCVTDEVKPVVGEVTATPSTVDVSDAAQLVRVEAHVTDDTGVKSVQIGNLATLVSGTARDGVWATTIRVPRYITPGPRAVDVFVRDRVGRYADATRTDAYTVVNSVADQEMPVLQSIALSTTAVDVRSAPRSITATVRVTDDLAGADDLFLCPAHAFPTGSPSFRQSGACVAMLRAFGTRTDSIWRATYVVAMGAPSGTWNFEVWISDAAGNFADDHWFGPDELAAIGPTSEPRYHAIPDGGGVFTVTGTQQDANAPELTSVSLAPSVVDTSRGAVLVTAEIEGTDVEGITNASLFINGYPGYPDNHSGVETVEIAWVEEFRLQQGTARGGVWRASFVVPGGTPDGQYFIQVVLRDSSHFESWLSPGTGFLDNHELTPQLAPTGNYFVVSNS